MLLGCARLRDAPVHRSRDASARSAGDVRGRAGLGARRCWAWHRSLGAIGALLLLLRRRAAVPLLLVSLIVACWSGSSGCSRRRSCATCSAPSEIAVVLVVASRSAGRSTGSRAIRASAAGCARSSLAGSAAARATCARPPPLSPASAADMALCRVRSAGWGLASASVGNASKTASATSPSQMAVDHRSSPSSHATTERLAHLPVRRSGATQSSWRFGAVTVSRWRG